MRHADRRVLAVGKVAEDVRHRELGGKVLVEGVRAVHRDHVRAAVIAEQQADLAPVRAEILARGILDRELHARRQQRLRDLAFVDPVFAAVRVDHLEPVGAAGLHPHGLAALDDVEDREPAAGAGAQLEIRVGHGHARPLGPGSRDRRQKDQQPAGREPRRHKVS